MTAYDPAADLAALGQLVAGLAADLAVIAEQARRAAAATERTEAFMGAVTGARRAGYREGLAEWDDRQADACARQARAGFTVLPGGASCTARSAPRKPRKRRTPGGAA